MKILIDATNIIAGGGLSHLQELLAATDEELFNANDVEKIYIVGVDNTLSKIKDTDRVFKIRMGNSQKNFISRYIWKKKYFNDIIKQHNIDIVFNPGGSFVSQTVPYITMCRNMLVFETEEANRFGFSLMRIKLFFLRYFQSKSMKYSRGTIFISHYAENYIEENYSIKIKNKVTIHHGVSDRFANSLKPQKNIKEYTRDNPYKILYVSIFDVYKHQAKIAEAVLKLSQIDQLPIQLICVGAKQRGYEEYEKIQNQYPQIIKHIDKVPFEEIQKIYSDADLFVFGSTCENMPNILIEAMKSGMPIVCSQKMPMPEFLGEKGEYFDVLNIDSIYQSLKKVIFDPQKREQMIIDSTKTALNYNWKNCANETFGFIKKCYENK